MSDNLLSKIKETFNIDNEGLEKLIKDDREAIYFKSLRLFIKDSRRLGKKKIHYKWDELTKVMQDYLKNNNDVVKRAHLHSMEDKLDFRIDKYGCIETYFHHLCYYDFIAALKDV